MPRQLWRRMRRSMEYQATFSCPEINTPPGICQPTGGEVVAPSQTLPLVGHTTSRASGRRVETSTAREAGPVPVQAVPFGRHRSVVWAEYWIFQNREKFDGIITYLQSKYPTRGVVAGRRLRIEARSAATGWLASSDPDLVSLRTEVLQDSLLEDHSHAAKWVETHTLAASSDPNLSDVVGGAS